ncbi:efflux RND transporter permease subunit [Legionella maceachernii]|uniref:Chemiosmotic efflux system protein A-like protein n=2 Tax=Legionella TaxID=445 RepID=A0A0W0VUZ3_9GAMM|nr:efflux RND transporter permease subunit [Legionella maceachernii]KTD23964.1 chemiosmotic efflux system protein A-like protein [Legionella maceachernii]SKA19047.1 heavy metal efflux pump, CzcA family [Legionella maceachernii]SUP04437.1 Cation efflux system protein CzcA [Legionella maceachernii]
MFQYLISWSLKNRLLILAITIAVCLYGGYTLTKMPVDVFPEFAPPQVTIQTQASGLAPQEVEALITYPLESAINGTPGVTRVRSKTAVGLSTITVVFADKTDIYRDRQLINERIQQVMGQLPSGANPVMLPVISVVGWLMKYALVSNTVSPEELRTISDWVIRPRILALGGVASVVSLGGEVKQYQVRLDPARMLAYRISVEEVNQALANSNRNVPGAFLQKSGTELIVGAIGRVKTLGDIRQTIITTRKGIPITIDNVATVAFGGEIKRGDAAYNLDHAVIGTISKTYGADTLATTSKVQEALDEIKASLPSGVKLYTNVFRQANFIESAIKNLSWALLEGALIVILVLFIFLMNIRASFITFMAMPVSFILGILVLYLFGFGINAMTLGGIAIAIGEVVDDGIITVENVLRRLHLNRLSISPQPAIAVVFDSILEIRNSVIYATLIISLVFLPIFFLSGIAERIFSPLAVAYIASVIGSLVVSITMVPALCYLLLVNRREKQNERQVILHPMTKEERIAQMTENPEASSTERETRFSRALKARFQRILNWALNHLWSVISLSGLGFVLALAFIPFFGTAFLPEFHEGNFIIAMATLPGTSLDESMRIGQQVRKQLLKYPQVISISQRAGRSAIDEDALPPNVSEFDVNLNFDKDKSVSSAELIRRIRQDLANIPGAVFNIGQFIAHRMDEVLSGVRSQIAIKIFGDNLQTLNQLGVSVESLLKTIPGVVDINKEQQINVPQLIIKIDREKAARYGINVGQISEDVQTLLNGVRVSSVLEGQRSFDLYVRMAESGRDTVRAVQDMLIDAHGAGIENGDKIPLRAVAQIVEEEQPFSISRENTQRMISVGFNVERRDLGSVIREVQEKIKNQIQLPNGYFIQYGGQFKSQQQATQTILFLGILAVVAMLLLLHKAFGQVREALLVLCNLPLALIGGVLSLYFTSGEMSVAAMIGFITLFGIAARNGIILVSHYNQLKAEGKPLQDIVIQGTLDRLVPVLMTAATAALGLIPLLWGSPVGKELERPLAQVLLGGLFTSTLLNMIVVPTLYNAMERRREKRMAHQSGEEHSDKFANVS